MSILGAIIVPHPPLIIPAVGRGREQEVQATIDAYRTAAKQVAAWEPEVLIITSPHQIMYSDYFHISPGRGATGDMAAFGASETKLRVEYDAQLRDEIIRCGESADLRVGILGQRDPYLDHGTFVPLYFCGKPGWTVPSSASACPDFRRWTTIDWGNVSLRRWRLWDAGRYSSPAVTCPTS